MRPSVISTLGLLCSMIHYNEGFILSSIQSKYILFGADFQPPRSEVVMHMANISEKDAQSSIEKVVQALRSDKAANNELGRIEKVTVVLGYGSPSPNNVAVRFNASFRKAGMGRSALPLPFGLGQTNQSEGRGTMVGQVKATVDKTTGKVTSCSVFRDLGYGRAFNLKV